MKKKVFSLFLLSFSLAFSGELHIDLSNLDPLTSAIFRGVEEAFNINEKGLDALQNNDLEEAERLFKQASTMIPIYSEARNNLGVLYFRTEREREAMRIWTNITMIDPDYFPAWFNLGLFNFRTGNAKEAEYFLETAYSKAPTNETVWSLYSYILSQNAQNKKAITILERKIPALSALKMLGEIHAVEGNFEQARSYLEQLRNIPNANRDFFETLAAVYNELGMYEETIQLFNEAQNRGDSISSEFEISYAWANACLKEGTCAQETSIDKGRGRSKIDSVFYLALDYHLSGNLQRASELYEEVLAIDRRYHRAWNNLGAIFGSKGEIKSAVSAYKNAVRGRSELADGYVNLVNIFSATNDARNARKWLRRGLRVAPDNEYLQLFKEQVQQ